MALNLLNAPNKWASLGSSLGKGLGEGITGGLDTLTQHKMQEIHQNKLVQGLMGQGYSPDIARQLSNLPIPLLQQHLKNDAMTRLQQQKHSFQQQQQKAFDQFNLNDFTGQQNSFNQPMQIANQRQPQEADMQMYKRQLAGEQLGNKIFGKGAFPGYQQPIDPRTQIDQQQPVSRAPIPNVHRAPMSLPIPQGINEKQYFQLLKHRESQQSKIDATNKKPVEELRVAVDNSKKMLELVDEMDALLGSGKVATGFKGKWQPRYLQNAETQQYAAKADELAILLAGAQRGVPSAYRIKVAQQTKPSIEQELLAQKGLQNDIRNKALDVIKRGDILDEIIQENDGYQPANIATLINQRYQQANKEPQLNNSKQQIPVASTQNQPAQSQEYSSDRETPIGTIGRNVISHAARLIEPEGEQLQNLASLGLGAANLLTGGNIPTYNQLREQFPLLPPAELREITDQFTNGYTKPQNAVENFTQELASLFGTLASPASIATGELGVAPKLAGVAKKFISPQVLDNLSSIAKVIKPISAMSPTKALKAMAFGKGAKGLTGLFTDNPLIKAGAELIGMVFANTPSGKGAMVGTAKEMWSEAKQVAAKDANSIAPTMPIRKQLDSLEKSINKSYVPQSSKAIELSIVEEAKKALARNTKKGSIPINDLVELKRGSNKFWKAAERPIAQGEFHIPEESKKIIGKVTDIFSQPIGKYGLENPKFGVPYTYAEDLWKATKDVSQINEFIQDNASLTLGLKTVLTKALGLGTAFLATASGARFYNYIKNHPAARKHYLNALQEASLGNKAAFAREAKMLDKAYNGPEE